MSWRRKTKRGRELWLAHIEGHRSTIDSYTRLIVQGGPDCAEDMLRERIHDHQQEIRHLQAKILNADEAEAYRIERVR